MHSTSLCSNDAKRVQCHWANHSRNMGMCVLRDLALAPDKLLNAVRESDVFSSNSLWLAGDINGAGKPCPKPDLRTLEKRLEPDDYIKSLVATSVLTVPKRKCQRWINETSFFYLVTNTHIYFKFLSWYNLHKTLHSHDNKRHFILQLPQNNQHFKFTEFEKLLFPEIVPLHSLGSEATCFRDVVLVPWAYSATPFRCKMEDVELKRKCFACDGKELTSTDLMTFRTKVLKACSLADTMIHTRPSLSQSILVIQRKQYLRHDHDEAGKFQRVWENSQDLIAALRRQYPTADVTAMHAEDLPICEQVRRAHKADLLIGIHGAGLVHLWWMQKNSVLFELVPPSQHGNAAFRMLARLLGRNIHSSVKVVEKKHLVRVSVQEVVQELKEVFPP